MIHSSFSALLLLLVGITLIGQKDLFAKSTSPLNIEEMREKFPHLGKTRREIFLNFINDHPNPGCPTNSGCSPEMGQKRQKWLNDLSNTSSTKKIAVPASVWIIPKKQLTPDTEYSNFITWISSCQHHRNLEDDKSENSAYILQGETFIKNLSDLIKDYSKEELNVILNRGYLYQKNDSNTDEVEYIITRYNLPGHEFPLMIKDNQIIYLLEEEGRYYSIGVEQSGKLHLLQPQTPKHFPQAVDCPKEIIKHFVSDLEVNNLYSGVLCRKLWDKSLQGFQKFAFGWTCD